MRKYIVNKLLLRYSIAIKVEGKEEKTKSALLSDGVTAANSKLLNLQRQNKCQSKFLSRTTKLQGKITTHRALQLLGHSLAPGSDHSSFMQ